MRVSTLIITISICFIFLNVLGQNSTPRVAIIPQPVFLTEKQGEFILNNKTQLFFSECSVEDIHVFINQLRDVTGFKLSVRKDKPKNFKNGISFRISKRLLLKHEHAYSIDVLSDNILVEAASVKGLFYATQSLRQLLPISIESKSFLDSESWSIPQVFIEDFPRFGWRGYMKDVSRTFYSVDVVKKYLDVMALYKLNVFHLHLTDDQGWRLEIKKHPELTSKKTTVFAPSHNQPANRSGFYTQEQIREIVQYAKERYITVVPEIDVPGHCWPIILVKPELGSNNVTKPDYVFPFNDSWGYWGFQFTPNPLDPTKEEVYKFLDEVFTEVVELFPSDYIHFGGDEVVHRLWENEPHIKTFMKQNNMHKIEELQSYFVNRISKLIVNKGRVPIGWNDILKDNKNLTKKTAIMSWTGSVKESSAQGLYTVATPTSPMYFDITQQSRDDGTMSDLNYGAINSLEKVYKYDPERGLSSSEKKFVLGIQANMWPAVPQDLKDINVQNFPRLLALSETAWTNLASKNYDSFLHRLENHYDRLDKLKIDYFRNGGYVVGTWDLASPDSNFSIAEWDVTKKVYASGSARTGFYYTSGAFLKVKNVQLLQDGKVISGDDHFAVADKFRGIPYKNGMFLFEFEIKEYDPKSQYILRAEIVSENKLTSKGNVTFNLNPYNSFEFVELRN